MNKNMTFKFKHEELGNLQMSISSGEAIAQEGSIVSPTLVAKHKNSDAMTFLSEVYTLYIGSNDVITDIVGELMTEDSSFTKTSLELASEITNRYSKFASKNNAKFNAPIKEGDGIIAKICSEKDPDEIMYQANIIVTKNHGQLSAYIDEQTTETEYRQKGLMSRAVNTYLPKYCQENNIHSISLEPGALDGVPKDTLAKIYESMGFEREAGNIFVKPVGPVDSNGGYGEGR